MSLTLIEVDGELYHAQDFYDEKGGITLQIHSQFQMKMERGFQLVYVFVMLLSRENAVALQPLGKTTGMTKMPQLKLMLINFLTEEDKFLSIVKKEESRKLLMKQSDLKLFDMVLEKARAQGHDIALDFYSKQSKAPDFCYKGVKKK